jgi:hypothetical protein
MKLCAKEWRLNVMLEDDALAMSIFELKKSP